MRGLNVTDVRREQISLLCSTGGETALAKGKVFVLTWRIQSICVSAGDSYLHPSCCCLSPPSPASPSPAPQSPETNSHITIWQFSDPQSPETNSHLTIWPSQFLSHLKQTATLQSDCHSSSVTWNKQPPHNLTVTVPQSPEIKSHYNLTVTVPQSPEIQSHYNLTVTVPQSPEINSHLTICNSSSVTWNKQSHYNL